MRCSQQYIFTGCTISSGVFIGMVQQSSDTTLGARYQSFDGSMGRRVSLNAGDEVSFAYAGDDGLRAVVKRNGEELCEITHGASFTAPEDGRYTFSVEGEAKDGSFALAWEIG